jgi:hypothetical protein
VHLDGLAPVMMAVNPRHRAGGRSCRDQLGAIRAEGGGQLVEAMDRVAGRGMRHVMRDDERQPGVRRGEPGGEPGRDSWCSASASTGAKPAPSRCRRISR